MNNCPKCGRTELVARNGMKLGDRLWLDGWIQVDINGFTADAVQVWNPLSRKLEWYKDNLLAKKRPGDV
jgi:hypothetical protein